MMLILLRLLPCPRVQNPQDSSKTLHAYSLNDSFKAMNGLPGYSDHKAQLDRLLSKTNDMDVVSDIGLTPQDVLAATFRRSNDNFTGDIEERTAFCQEWFARGPNRLHQAVVYTGFAGAFGITIYGAVRLWQSSNKKTSAYAPAAWRRDYESDVEIADSTFVIILIAGILCLIHLAITAIMDGSLKSSFTTPRRFGNRSATAVPAFEREVIASSFAEGCPASKRINSTPV